MKVAAIYSRKSKFTGKGESVENQVQLCRQYGANMGIENYLVYEDEGFSGGNIDRPEFQRLLRDARLKRFDVLICYRLDRISRNVADFSTLIKDLQNLNIDFVSIREQFDTSTPLGRAMMYISSVFAQLERETIAERIRDNMMELAKSGRWLGGYSPYGFKSEAVEYYDAEMKQKKMYKLAPNPDEMDTVKMLFTQYLELGSAFKVSKYCMQNHITGRNGGAWNPATITQTLKRVEYAKSSQEISEYLERQGVAVLGDPDRVHGYISYNKSYGENKAKDKNEWITVIAKHEGLIASDTWLQVQRQLVNNYQLPPRAGKSNTAFLTGILKCAHCSSAMSIMYGVKRKDGTAPYYYTCPKKRLSGGFSCNNPNASSSIEQYIIDKLKQLSMHKESVLQEYESYREAAAALDDTTNEILKIKSTIAKNETAIQNLVKQLSTLSDSASSYVISEIERLSQENSHLKGKLFDVQNQHQDADLKQINIDLFLQSIANFGAAIDACKTTDEKRQIIKSIVDKITWDGQTGNIDIKLIGAE
jgi:site-specific DNA recombinase